jgi:hypothetical protein
MTIGGISLPTTTIWEAFQRHGQRLVEHVEHQQIQVSPERTKWHHRRFNPSSCKSVSMDGGMVYICGEGWKEMKVGVVSDVVEDWTDEERTIQLQNLDYTAVIGTAETFKDALWALSVQHEVTYAGTVAVIADGAHWIWRLTDELYPESKQIVDWYHAKQHLAEAAHACHPDADADAQQWLNRMSTPLFRGEAWKIIEHLHERGLPENARYFQTHQHRMHYQSFKAAGLPIGSGAVESGIKQFKHRLTGPGMRWSRTGAERMSVIRGAIMADSFDTLWNQAA